MTATKLNPIQLTRFTARFMGRKIHAIGVFYPIETTVDAVDEDSARLTLYDRFEHISGLELAPLMPQPDLETFLRDHCGCVDGDFAYHASDLYVVMKPAVVQWLRANYRYWNNVQRFVSQAGSGWNGAGRVCLDIPFANHQSTGL